MLYLRKRTDYDDNLVIDVYIFKQTRMTMPLFKSLSLLNIYDVFKSETLKFVYDSVNKNNPSQFHSFFSFHAAQNVTTAAARNKHLIRPSPRTSNYGIKSLKYTGVILWNNLSLNLRILTSKKSFSKALKVTMLNSYE